MTVASSELPHLTITRTQPIASIRNARHSFSAFILSLLRQLFASELISGCYGVCALFGARAWQGALDGTSFQAA